MLNLKKSLALLSSLVFLISAASCGQQATESSLIEESILVSTSDDSSETENQQEAGSDKNNQNETSEKDNSNNSSDSQETSDNNNDDSSADNNQSATEAPANNNQNTLSDNSQSGGNSDTNSNSGTSAGNTQQSGNTSSSSGSGSSSSNTSENTQQSGSSSSNTSSGSSGSSSSSSSSSSGSSSSNTQQTTEPVVEAPTEEVKTYAAEITLGSSPSVNGTNAAADGANVVITGGGDYLISGSVSDGQILVNTTEKVKLYFNGVNIHCSSGPAVLVNDAKRFIIVLMEGTTSTLTDAGANLTYDGVIFSNDTVELKGKGSLNITSGNRHGITSDDDVVIENGNITINSVKTGIMANDDITINGGNLNIKSGTNGMKSKGTMNINGGFSVICGGTKEEKSSLYAAGALTYTDGYLFAAGNAVTAPSQTVAPYVVAGFSPSCAAGSSVSVSVNGSEKAAFAPHNVFKCVMALAPEINIGGKVDIKINGNSNEVAINDTANVVTLG